MKFISSPFSLAAVDLLEKVGVDLYKVGSGEITNLLMLEKIAKTGKEVIISSGMSSMDELGEAISFLQDFSIKVSLLQCTTSYPTLPKQWGLNLIHELGEKFNIPIGFSDHSGDIFACLAAASLGAEIFEFHVVFDKRQFGPDSKASITIDDCKRLCDGIRQIQTSLKIRGAKKSDEKFIELKRIFGKSLAVNKDLIAGHVLTFDDLESKKPGDKGISAKDYKLVLGKKISRPMSKWEFLNFNDIH